MFFQKNIKKLSLHQFEIVIMNLLFLKWENISKFVKRKQQAKGIKVQV